jgi:hypothetical protein
VDGATARQPDAGWLPLLYGQQRNAPSISRVRCRAMVTAALPLGTSRRSIRLTRRLWLSSSQLWSGRCRLPQQPHKRTTLYAHGAYVRTRPKTSQLVPGPRGLGARSARTPLGSACAPIRPRLRPPHERSFPDVLAKRRYQVARPGRHHSAEDELVGAARTMCLHTPNLSEVVQRRL